MKLNTYDCATKTRYGRDAFQTGMSTALEAGCLDCGDSDPDEMYFVNMDSSPWSGCGKCAINHYAMNSVEMICVCDVCSGYNQEQQI